MPVLELSLSKLQKLAGAKTSESQILDALPYLGLDIEGTMGDVVSVEYSPNRPDFSSEVGIARSLLGFLGIQTGLPKYDFVQSQNKVLVDQGEIKQVRPHIFALSASIPISDETIKQIITMQEDLHNGLGRRRSKVAIGIHNADAIKPPIKYYATRDRNFSFVPLGGAKPLAIAEIMEKTDQGVQYGRLLSSGAYPILADSAGNVLSMPPIINGELTRLRPGITKLFVDVTATDENAGDAVTAIIASMLTDIGARVETVSIEDGGSTRLSPNMTPRTMRFDLDLANRILGLNLTVDEARIALEKSRLSLLPDETVLIPRFRADIIHPIDLVEDVALGYGVANLSPLNVESPLTGPLHPRNRKIGRMVDLMVGLGFTEIFNLSLTNEFETNLSGVGSVLRVDDAKSQTYEFLKPDLLPSLLTVLGSSTHEEYPQKVFEEAPVYLMEEASETTVLEQEHLAAALSETGANFSTIRSILDGFLRLAARKGSVTFSPAARTTGVFASGRVASVLLSNGEGTTSLGLIGEVSPQILEKVGIKVPVAAFELNLEPLLCD